VANDPPLRKNLSGGKHPLVKADLGLKRVCPSCGSRFYDLQKRPIECPKCAFAFEPDAIYKQRRPRQPEPVAAEPVRSQTDDEDEDAEEEEEDAPEGVEKIADESPLIVSDEDEDEEETVDQEEEAEGAGMTVVESDGSDIEDIDVEDDEDEEDDGLLEEVEDEDDDVSDIIDTDIEKDDR
jgi:uncharacterized protein (TIGR02300 family)